MWVVMGFGIKAAASQTYCGIAHGTSVFQRDSQGNGNVGDAGMLKLLETSRTTSLLDRSNPLPRTTLHTATSSVRGVEMRGPRMPKITLAWYVLGPLITPECITRSFALACGPTVVYRRTAAQGMYRTQIKLLKMRNKNHSILRLQCHSSGAD